LRTETKLSNILAAQRIAQIAELHGLRRLCCIVRVCSRVHGEELIVAEGKDGVLGQESGVVDGAVVDYLH
jgi:hypothetical protein